MSQDTQWRQLVPGLILSATVIALGAAVLLFARVGALHGDTFRIYGTTSGVRGITKGSDVFLSGRKVGIVADVAFRSVEADTSARILLTLDVLSEYRPLIRRNSSAQLRTGGTLLGAPVIYIDVGTPAGAAIQDGDTIRALPQGDPEALTSRFAHASLEFPEIISNVKLLNSQLKAASGTIGAFIGDSGTGAEQLQGTASRASALLDQATSRRGTVGLALRNHSGVIERANRSLAQVDSIRQLLSAPHTSYGRFQRDTTLLRTVNDVRNEVSIARALLAEPRGTAGRVLADSAILLQLKRGEAELGALMKDITARPLRYFPF